MEPQTVAPPAVAVVVTSDPGPWFEDALAALARQDYPNLSVLVIDAGSTVDPSPRVAAALPGAYIRRLPSNPGYSAAANEALGAVEGATYLVLCHDDVAPEPSAIRLMIDEATRSNAGVVGPKLVRWDDPERLLQVGIGADKTGAAWPLVERGELDQEQHDNVRDVFAVPGGCTVVRADLFHALGGFDPVMRVLGEDLDLCWRAQVAGARVLVAPEARVRHLEALPSRRGQRPDRRRLLQTRHRLRSSLKCYGPLGLARVLPQAAFAALLEIVFALVTGRGRQAADVAKAWTWNASHLGDTAKARRLVQRSRRVPDGDIRRLQVRGSARLRGYLRGQVGTVRGGGLAAAGRGLAGSVSRSGRRSTAITALVAALVLLAGSRHLIGGRLPLVGQFAPFPDGPGTFLRHYLTGWRFSGLGSASPAPPAFAFLGLAGVVFLGGMGLLQKVLVLGALPLGAVGAWRLARHLGSSRVRLVAAVLYLAVPLPYNAIARGRFDGLVAYALAPWLLARVMAASGDAPFAGEGRPPVRRIVGLGILLAVATALAPAVAPLLVLVAVALVVGSLLAGGIRPAVTALVATAGAVVVAALLLVPWSAVAVTHWSVFGVVPLPAARAAGLGDLLRFHTGPIGTGPFGWLLLVAAALPLVVGREWRLAWAVRLWTVALACWGVAWASGRHWVPAGILPLDVLLVPAALSLALCVGLGLAAFETDLRNYRFGWRQFASVTAAASAALVLLPVLARVPDGRWRAPAGDDDAAALAWMHDEVPKGSFRVLWVGDPAHLPLDGWRVEDGVAWALSRNGVPDATALWPGPAHRVDAVVPRALAVTAGRRTTRVGRLLAPAAVRYIVLPTRVAPGSGPRTPPPAEVAEGLGEQLDLRRIDTDGDLVVYENTDWFPAIAALPAGTDAAAPTAAVLPAAVSGAHPVLRHRAAPARFTGTLAAGGDVTLAEAFSPRWRLAVAGRRVQPTRAFGLTNAFAGPGSGRAALTYRTPPSRLLALVAQLVLWLLALRVVLRGRRRPSDGEAA